jgi:hypothetical protein
MPLRKDSVTLPKKLILLILFPSSSKGRVTKETMHWERESKQTFQGKLNNGPGDPKYH